MSWPGGWAPTRQPCGCTTIFASRCVAVAALPGCCSLPALPEAGERVGFAQCVGTQLQNGFCPRLRPKLFAALHPLIDLLDRRFDMARRDGQALLTVGRVTHAFSLVLQVRQGLDRKSVGRERW